MTQPTTTTARYAKAIIYEPEGREFSMWLDNILVGYARTYREAEESLDELVYALLTRADDDMPACTNDAEDRYNRGGW